MLLPHKKYKKQNKDRPVLKSYFKQKKTVKYEFNIDMSVIKTPTDLYWNKLADKMKIDVNSCYTGFIKKYFKQFNFLWTDEADTRLLNLIDQNLSWHAIGFVLNVNPLDCIRRYYRLTNKKTYWSEDEDRKLLELVDKFSHRWVQISTFFSDKSRAQCLQRYKKLSEGIKKGKWSADEDKLLKSAVEKYIDRGWKYISQFLPARSDSQCRERWVNSLNPSLKKGKWSKEEDELLLSLIGQPWLDICKKIEGRTAKQCRKRYFKLIKKT